MRNKLTVLAVLLLPLVARAADDGLERAMSAELSRASSDLREEGYPAVYYAALTAIDQEIWEERCQMGARSFENTHRQRLVTPDLRVGSYALDNHPITPPTGFVGRVVARDDDEFALRHELWLAFDGAYKNAAADFLRKEAIRVSRGKTEYDTDDFTKESPVARPAPPPPSRWSTETLEALCASASRVFRGEPDLLSAEALVRLNRSWSRLRDSEGSAVDFGRDVAEIELDAVSISTDGMKHFASRKITATDPDAVPKPDQLQADARDMLADLKALSVAATTSPFSAPALFEPAPAAAAALAVAQRMSGEEQRNPNGAQTFRGKLGKPVLPPDFSIVDDPTLRSYHGTILAGHYDFDDQGQAPRRVTLVENGVLRNFLLSRYPVVGFSKSNGHGRAYPGYSPEGAVGSLFLTSRRPVAQKKLLARLREECRRRGKAYGLWVRGLRLFVQQQGAGGQGSIRFMPSLLYLVDAKTGATTLVRDLDVVSTPLDLLNNIVAAGDDVKVQNVFAGVPISLVVPSLVLSDAELQRADTRPEKPPILPPPVEEAAAAPGSSPRIPFVPLVPFIQVQRYVLRGYAKPLPEFVMAGVVGFREHGEGADLIVDIKLRGRNLPSLADAVRSMDRLMGKLRGPAKVEVSTLAGPQAAAEYRRRYQDGWPQ